MPKQSSRNGSAKSGKGSPLSRRDIEEKMVREKTERPEQAKITDGFDGPVKMPWLADENEFIDMFLEIVPDIFHGNDTLAKFQIKDYAAALHDYLLIWAVKKGYQINEKAFYGLDEETGQYEHKMDELTHLLEDTDTVLKMEEYFDRIEESLKTGEDRPMSMTVALVLSMMGREIPVPEDSGLPVVGQYAGPTPELPPEILEKAARMSPQEIENQYSQYLEEQERKQKEMLDEINRGMF